MNNNEIKNLDDALAIIQALRNENEKLKQQNANLTEMIVKSQKKMLGKSSEQLKYIDGTEQLSIFNEAEQENIRQVRLSLQRKHLLLHIPEKQSAQKKNLPKILNTKK